MKKNIKKIIPILIILICLVGVFYSVYNIVRWKLDISENITIKKQIDESIRITKNIETEEPVYEIDFNELRKINNDLVGYIKVNGTDIGYTVVKGNDNNYYLDHNFEKRYNKAGWIFADYHNKFDGSDKNIIVFGHNMRDGSMFGSLKNILDENWYNNKDNHIVYLITETGTYCYKVFSTYISEPEEYYLTTDFATNDAFDLFIKELKNRSNRKYDVEVNSNDLILTLSSCISNGTKRLVLHAKLL